MKVFVTVALLLAGAGDAAGAVARQDSARDLPDGIDVDGFAVPLDDQRGVVDGRDDELALGGLKLLGGRGGPDDKKNGQ